MAHGVLLAPIKYLDEKKKNGQEWCILLTVAVLLFSSSETLLVEFVTVDYYTCDRFLLVLTEKMEKEEEEECFR